MTVDTAAYVRRNARGVPRLRYGSPVIEGPLKGHYRETYVIALPDRAGRCKVHEPRSGLLRFDRRCFASEDRLLQELQGRVTRIPEIVSPGEGVLLQGFIEGRTLGRGLLSRSLSQRHSGQLAHLFRELVSLDVDAIGVGRLCDRADHPADGDSAGFLDRMITFTESQVYERHGDRYGALFHELGVGDGALDGIRGHARRLTGRPFALVHGDLHRLNFIVDANGDLWTIDWELAMIGDPLYDLATHLHLMRYPRQEARRIALLWAEALNGARPECAKGWREDVEILRAYKRAQSVYTDVIRGAIALEQSGDRVGRSRLVPVARRVRQVLAEARGPLALETVPTLRQVMAAYARWLRGRAGEVTASAP